MSDGVSANAVGFWDQTVGVETILELLEFESGTAGACIGLSYRPKGGGGGGGATNPAGLPSCDAVRCRSLSLCAGDTGKLDWPEKYAEL